MNQPPRLVQETNSQTFFWNVLFDLCWSAMLQLLVAAGPPVPAANAALAVPAAVLQLHLLERAF